MKKKMNSKKGFTLVEIIVVLVILAIMAGFAIPAYNGYIDKAKQSEVLAEGRTLLIAAQTVGQEQYGKNGDLKADAGTKEAIIYAAVKSLSDTKGIFKLTFDAKGIVTAATLQNEKKTHVATFTGTAWSVAAVETALTEPTLPENFVTHITLP